MSKLNVGDKVLILPRTLPYGSYSCRYTDAMESFHDEIATVTEVSYNCYVLDVCDCPFFWDYKALLKLDKPVNYDSLDEGRIIVFKTGDNYIKGTVTVSLIGNYYIRLECNMSQLNKLCSMTVLELTKKFFGEPRPLLTAKNKEKLKEMLDFINNLTIVETVKFDDKPINQEHYVAKLQRTKALIRRAEVPKGSRVCSKINKAAISIQSLGYTICSR